MNDYHTTIALNSNPMHVFNAITHELTQWWGPQDKIAENEGVIFKVAWGEPWYQFKVIAYEPHERIVWECIDANQKISGLEGVEKEWVGTTIHWELEAQGEQTLLHFKHVGLNPDVLCFNFCSESWDHFLKDSLVSYLNL